MENHLIALSSIRLNVQSNEDTNATRKTLHYTLNWLNEHGPGIYHREYEEGPYGNVPTHKSLLTWLLLHIQKNRGSLSENNLVDIFTRARPFDFADSRLVLESPNDLLQCLLKAERAAQDLVPPGMTVGQCIRRY